ncbi:hypothetical protein SAMN05661096_02741 [Marivirga sericea]|uniref:40-residue YVTN family beta-propeller repeat-containing protein n=1 Tax=Marivirga sericea TaxID=1028 RepID=A0A1X7KGB4_9BACT|nr:DUF5074 domain-containing protein [Marivirga sericea]SMG40350.1 hypothetical protein SAMN05661096_02741 [Marivirga sericea]
MINFNLAKNSAYLILCLLLIFTACKEDEVTPDDEAEIVESDSLVLITTNILIFHEGGFQANNATIGSYNPITQEYQSTSFRDENGSFIGDVQQSVLSNNGIFYSVLNGSNAIKVLDSASLSLSVTIEDEAIDKPRNIAVAGDKAYLSNWGPYNDNFGLSDSRILTIDLNNNSVTGSIDTQEGLEDVQIIGNTLLATRFFFGSYQHLTFINLDNNEILNDIELPAGPEEILMDASGNAWVVCNSGALLKIDIENTSIAETVELGGEIYGDADIYENAIYFLQNNEVKAYNLSSGSITSIATTKAIQTPYAFAVDPVSGAIYIGDGVDFSDGGTVLIYSRDGDLINEFVSGILPTQFVFETELQVFEEEEED